MKIGDKFIYNCRGYLSNGEPTDNQYSEELKFDQYVIVGNEVKIICYDKDNIIKVVPADHYCKIVEEPEKNKNKGILG